MNLQIVNSDGGVLRLRDEWGY